MTITKQRISQIIKEELSAARLYAHSMNEEHDDMDTDGDDMGIDVVADDADDDTDGEDDMGGEDMGGDDMMTSEEDPEIDWSQFDDQDGDAVGAAFLDAVKLLRDEQPEETPSAAAVVERMQEILTTPPDADDNAFSDDPATLAEGVDWRHRAGVLAGITKRS